MFISTIFAIATVVLSLFTFASATPAAITQPRSLLGRHYRDIRVRHLATPQRRHDIIDQGDEPTTRADRFLAIQRKIAEIGTRDDRLHDHDRNLLSNQSFGSPPAVQTPIPVPSPTPTPPQKPVALLPNSGSPAPRVRAKHSKGKKSRGKVMKA